MLLIFGVRFAFGLFDEPKRERTISANGLSLLIGLIIGTSLICGGIYHWFFEVYRPKRLVKLFNKIKTLDLQEFGLKVDENEENFNGHYKGYYITVFPDSTADTGDWIRTNVFIIPKATQEELYIRLAKKYDFNSGDGLVWFTCKTKMKFGRVPKIEIIKQDINELVDALRYERVDPLLVTD